MSSAAKYAGFDSMRGIAALLVFIFHFYGLSGMVAIAGQGFLHTVGLAGHVGLDIFFVLSGFFIFRSIYINGVNKTYFQRRFFRIAPIYYFSLIIALAFLTPVTLTTLSGMKDIVAHLFFLQSFSPSTYYGINPVLWSLSIEMIFYFFLPLFFIITKKNTRRIIVFALLMAIASYLFRYYITTFYGAWDSITRVIFTENFIGRADQFAFGMLASLVVLRYPGNKILTYLSPVFLAIGAVGIYWGMSVFAELGGGFRDVLFYQIFLHSLIGLFTALFFVGLFFAHKGIKVVMGNPITEFLGKISYSFYIWHFIVIEQVMKLTLGLTYSFLYSLAIALVLSTMTYYFVEKPFLDRRGYPHSFDNGSKK